MRNNHNFNSAQAVRRQLDRPLSQPDAASPSRPQPRGPTGASLDRAPAIQWDWPGWLPHGFLTILASEPGVGKSFLALAIAASYIDGRPWPDGTQFTVARGPTLWAETESGQKMHRQRLLGSPILARVARVVWLLDIPDPADPGHLRFSMVKNNLAPLAAPIGVRIDAHGPHFGPPPQPPAAQSEEDRAVALLMDLLANGPLPVKQVNAAAAAAGISGPTLYSAGKSWNLCLGKAILDRNAPWIEATEVRLKQAIEAALQT